MNLCPRTSLSAAVRSLLRCAFCALTATAAAQTETGRITGVVTDATGGILPGVTVTAKAVGTGATRTVITDSAASTCSRTCLRPIRGHGGASGFNPPTRR